jgi:hypothetical protein
VIPTVAFIWGNPFAIKSVKWSIFEIHTCQNVTGTEAKENSVRSVPSFLRVFLESGFRPIQ